MAFVVDNSIVVAWFVASQASPTTEALLGRAATEDVHVPAIWHAEFASALLSLSHRRKLAPARLPEILADIEQLDFIQDPAPPTARALVAIGRRYGLSAYDACYLELAMRLRAPLAARDLPLRRAAGRAGLLLV